LRLTSSGGALEQVSSYDVPKLSSSGGTPKQASSACAKEQASSGGTFAIGAFKEVFVCRAVSQGVAYARVPDAGCRALNPLCGCQQVPDILAGCRRTLATGAR